MSGVPVAPEDLPAGAVCALSPDGKITASDAQLIDDVAGWLCDRGAWRMKTYLEQRLADPATEPHGICRECHGDYAITRADVVAEHDWEGGPCPGSDRLPTTMDSVNWRAAYPPPHATGAAAARGGASGGSA